MFPLLIKPLGRIFITEEALLAPAATEAAVAGAGPVVRSVMSSDFLVGETAGTGGEVDAGMEKPTTDEVGRALRDGPEGEAAAEEEGRRREAHDFLTAGVAAGVG